MARTVIAVFESVYSAEQAVWELLDQGFPRERIDLFTERLAENMSGLVRPEKVCSEVVIGELRAGANIGAGIGGSLGITGGLLILLGAMHAPSFLAGLTGGTQAGPLAAAILILAIAGLSTAAGGLFGSLISGLVGLGIPEEEIRQYAKNVRKGNVTLMIVADWDAVDGTLEVLGRHNPLEVRQKSIESLKAEQRKKNGTERARKEEVPGQHRPR